MKPFLVHGKTDGFGFYAVENKVHVHDLHVRILHLFGIDHLNLTCRFQGRDFRLTTSTAPSWNRSWHERRR
jgi:hypothetical protein